MPPAHTACCHPLQEIVLESPYGDELPQRGFDAGEETFQAPPPSAQRAGVQVSVDPASSRLQLLEPFKKWDGDDIKVGAGCRQAGCNESSQMVALKRGEHSPKPTRPHRWMAAC